MSPPSSSSRCRARAVSIRRRPNFWKALRKVCDEHGILLIADEVQTGFARTGKMFGIENSGVEPDLITIAKSLAGGFPLSGVIGRAAIMDAPDPGGLGGTYAGSPIACAAALAVLDVIAEEKLIERANTLGERIKGELARIAQRNDTVAMSAIRGPGAMVAFDIVKSRGGEEPDADATKRVTAAALAEGLVLLSCGVHANTIRILMPLTISDADPRRRHGQARKGAGRGERVRAMFLAPCGRSWPHADTAALHDRCSGKLRLPRLASGRSWRATASVPFRGGGRRKAVERRDV